MPMAWRWEYIVIDPTYAKPAFFISLLTRSESSVCTGISEMSCQWLIIGWPSTKCQIHESKEPYFFWIAQKAHAFLTAASSFRLFRISLGFASRLAISSSRKPATICGSKSANAFRYASRLPRTVRQDKPACWVSSSKNSKWIWSSWTGLPHSLSWYWM